MLARQRTGRFLAECDRCLARKDLGLVTRDRASSALLEAGWKPREGTGRHIEATKWCSDCSR